MQPIERVAVIGAGNMGSGIAQKSAQERFAVQMVDREKKWVERGQETIRGFLEEAVKRRIFHQNEAELIKSRVEGVVGVDQVAENTDLVIEAVFEDFGIKSEVFATLDSVCSKNTILASNTSSLSVNALAEATLRSDRFIGLHFFYHPAKNRLVEVIPAETTSRETINRVVQYCKMLGKVVIVCKDRPGFVVNRFFVPWLNEACRLLEEGIATTAQIDSIACEAFQIAMGPFALMNLTGPPIALHSTDYLSEQLECPRYRGAENLRMLVENGETWEIRDSEACDEQTSTLVKERLLGQIFAVAAQIADEKICSIEDVDRGAKVGLRWFVGPFELMNEIGISEAYRMADAYAKLCGNKFVLPSFFSEKSREGDEFLFRYIDINVENSIATIRLNRPEAMNALNQELIEQLGEALDDLNMREDISAIVLEGAGKAFVAGADVKFFVDKIRSDSLTDIKEFTLLGHEVFAKLEESPKTTIALATGLALGGGLELALACDYRIGTRRTQFRFPETSIGIYPGLGGTQRTPRICGAEAARWAVLGGNFVDPETANALGLLTHLVDPSELGITISNIVNEGKPANKYPGEPVDAQHPVTSFAASFYGHENLPVLMEGGCPEGFDAEDKNVVRQLRALNRAAPIALRMANELIEGADRTGTDLTAGLALELNGLNTIFGTEDALEGLSALIEGRRPSFMNK